MISPIYFAEPCEQFLGNQITSSDYISVFRTKMLKTETLEAMKDILKGNVISTKIENNLHFRAS